ncbi:MAG: hypothetical protein J6V72_06720, partial [Kiritimatiellae bacterium]|nr:hypothetical protein [Kiritimatiellia bacterium]
MVETGDEATVAARAGKLLRPALSVAGDGPHPVRIAHRQTAEGEVFFVMNDSGKPWNGHVSLRDRRVPLTLWDPAADASAPVPREADGSVRIALGPWSAVVLSVDSP